MKNSSTTSRDLGGSPALRGEVLPGNCGTKQRIKLSCPFFEGIQCWLGVKAWNDAGDDVGDAAGAEAGAEAGDDAWKED